MTSTAILLPVFALAGWTAIVLLMIPFRRVRAGLKGQVSADDFRYGESDRVPPQVSIPNRNYMNLLEVPILFYVACLMLQASGRGATPAILTTAWIYVALRIAHSIVHLGYNQVLHRLALFATSNVVLVVLWVLAFRQLMVTAP